MEWVGIVTGVLLISVALVFHRRQPRQTKREYSLGSVLFGVFVVLAVAVPASVGFLATCSYLLKYCGSDRLDIFYSALSAMVTPGIGIAAIFVLRGRLFAKWSTVRFVSVVLGLAVVLRLAYVIVLDVQPVSDFNTMWSTAMKARAAGIFQLSADTSMERRVVPYLYPLVAVFGDSGYVYKIANVCCFALSVWIVFVLARRWFGEFAARATLVLLVLVPETFFASAIPSHDVPGALYLLLGLLLADSLLTSLGGPLWKTVALSLGFGAVGLALNIQRGTFVFLLFSLGAGAFVAADRAIAGLDGRFSDAWPKWRAVIGHWAVFVFAVPVCVFYFGYKALYASGVFADESEASDAKDVPWLVSNSDSWGDGTWAHANKTYYQYYNGMPSAPEAWSGVAEAKILAEIRYNPRNWILRYFRKSMKFYSLGSQDNFYYVDEIVRPESLIRGRNVKRALNGWNRSFTAIFLLALVIASAAQLINKNQTPRTTPAISFIASLSAGLLLFGENQPRYLYPVWFVFPLLVPPTWEIVSKTVSKKMRLGLAVSAIWPKTVVVLGSAVFLFGTTQLFGGRSDSAMLDFREWKDVRTSCAAAGDFWGSIQSPINAQRIFQLMLKFPCSPEKGGRISISKEFVFNDNRPRRFSVFVVDQDFFEKKSRGKHDIDVVFSTNGEERRRLSLPAEHAAERILISDIIPEMGRIEIEMGLEASIKKKNRPLVRFEFAQLTRQ